MHFSSKIDEAPRNQPLMMRVRVQWDGGREYIGIGVIQVHEWDGNRHETVQFSFVNESRFDTTPPAVSSPSGVTIADIVSWSVAPSGTEKRTPDEELRAAVQVACERLATASAYADPNTVNNTVASVAEDLHAALKANA